MPVRGSVWVLGLCGLVWSNEGWAQAPAAQFPAEQAPDHREIGDGTTPHVEGNAPPVTVVQGAPVASSPVAGAASAAPARPPAERVAETSVREERRPNVALAHDWALGGGVGASDFSTGSFWSQAQPLYRGMLERRIGARSWLTLNTLFSYYSHESPVIATNGMAPSRERAHVSSTAFTLLLGVRYAFVQGPVEVSASLAGYGAMQHGGGDDLQGGESVEGVLIARGDTSAIGAVAGLSVERELIDALGLRLSMDVGSIGYSRGDTWQLDQSGNRLHERTNGVTASVNLRPSLILSFYF